VNTAFFWVITQREMVIPYRRLGQAIGPILTLEDGVSTSLRLGSVGTIEDVCRGPGQTNNLVTINTDTFQFFSLGQGCEFFLRARSQIGDKFRRNSSACEPEFPKTIFPIIPVTS
jgi:hypothetical protein